MHTDSFGRFEMGFQTFDTIFEAGNNKEFDFVFTFPNMAGCLEMEFNAAPLLTLRNFRRNIELNRYGGVIFTTVNRTDITSVKDLRGKVVMGTSPLLCQHQWRVFQENGINMFGDVDQVTPTPNPCPAARLSLKHKNLTNCHTAQMMFSGDENVMLENILRGVADAGFTRTDSMEAWEQDASKIQYKGKFKIVSVRENVMIEGVPFPFNTSSQLYPENGILVMPWVEHSVRCAFAP